MSEATETARSTRAEELRRIHDGKARMSVGDVAQVVGESVDTVRRWIRAGHLKAYQNPGARGHIRVHPDDLAEFMRNTRT